MHTLVGEHRDVERSHRGVVLTTDQGSSLQQVQPETDWSWQAVRRWRARGRVFASGNGPGTRLGPRP